MNSTATSSGICQRKPELISSSTESGKATTRLQDLADYVQDGWIMLWQHHAVFAIPVTDRSFQAPASMEQDQARHMQRVRAFNQDREWHVWRTEDGFQGRKRQDHTDGPQLETTDSEARLRGVIVQQLGDRNPTETWVVQTRNYIGYNAFHHAGYTDSRFVNIIKIGKEIKS